MLVYQAPQQADTRVFKVKSRLFRKYRGRVSGNEYAGDKLQHISYLIHSKLFERTDLQ